ncbi:Rv3235 family protein [Streptomyces sp. NPDC006134]|uniref:Rv3235 family protein n=1 Tax=Streptomyces sp. NPDC006134 TaxID=3154467 RepID=UPI003403D6C1
MHKVMTRAHQRPGSTRPSNRHDSRRPGTAPSRTPGSGSPPRTPGGGALRTAAPGGRRPGSPGEPPRARVRPLDTRPPTAREAGPAVPVRLPHGPLPQPRPTDMFAERLLGVLSGRRPVHSMLRHTAGRAYDELVWLAEHHPLRTRGTHPVVRDIGWFEPRPGAVEVFARIGAGDRLRALAFRLERGRDLRWRCTAVELGGPRMPRTDDA